MASWETYLEENQDRYLKELLEFLSIPSGLGGGPAADRRP
jgi:hypothetical protein